MQSIYPNPVDDILYLKFPEFISCLLQIIDLTGRVQFTEAFTATDLHMININNLDKGIYFIKINWKNKSAINRFVKL